MAYGVVRTDKLMGTDVRSMLESVKYMGAGSTATAIDNGNVVKLDGSLMTGEREIKKGVTPAANDALDAIVLIASPEVMYDERKRNLDEFQNEAGKVCRGYHLHSGDIFSVTKDALDGAATPAVGNVVELKAGIKLNVAASATNGSTVVGKIIAVDVVGRYTYYVIQVA
ncbi:MAG: hypothetical protein O0V67_05945 [Methanocorpusculum sp.]|nr:hypothetical protein [Methanocorpusculum sp.]